MTGTWFAEGSQSNAWRGDPAHLFGCMGYVKVCGLNLDRIVNSLHGRMWQDDSEVWLISFIEFGIILTFCSSSTIITEVVGSCRSTVGLGYTYFYFTFNEPESKGGYHITVPHDASLESQEAIVKLLLDAGADVNASSAYYGAPLATASAWGHDSVVKLLAASNAFLYAFGVRYGIT